MSRPTLLNLFHAPTPVIAYLLRTVESDLAPINIGLASSAGLTSKEQSRRKLQQHPLLDKPRDDDDDDLSPEVFFGVDNREIHLDTSIKMEMVVVMVVLPIVVMFVCSLSVWSCVNN